MFLQIAERFNVDMKGVPVVGDSLRDLQGRRGVALPGPTGWCKTGKGAKTQADPALPAGTLVFPIWLPWPPSSPPEVSSRGPDPQLLFMLALAVLTPLYALIAMATFPFGPKTRHRIIRGWPHLMAWVVKHVLGIPYRLVGAENIPAGPAIVMSKHMSAWETIMLQDIFPPMVFVMKREIHKLPFFGWGIAQMPMIAIDRAAGKDALAQVVEQGIDRLGHGFWVTIFPEGTRVARAAASATRPAAPCWRPKRRAGGAGGPQRRRVLGPQRLPQAPGRGGEHRPGDRTRACPRRDQPRAEAWVEGEMHRLFPHYAASTPKKESAEA
jgi:1-acyl-sn-glycerol-3-phosphate acyltransferase